MAVRFGEMHDVHPVPCPALTVVWTGEKTIHNFFVSIGGLVGEKAVDGGMRWRQADQIKIDTAQDRSLIRGGGGA